MKEEAQTDKKQQSSEAATLYLILMPEGPVTDSTEFLFIWGGFAFMQQMNGLIRCYLMAKILYFNFLLKEEFTHTLRYSQYLLTQMLMGSFVVHKKKKNSGESIEGK